jgi:hypothetical protein
MSKISTYEVAPLPKLSDKLIGTSVGGEIEDATYNFTLQELLDVFLPVIPANNLQGILDFGNTATQDINLFGTINTTNLNVTDTANIYIAYLNEETHIVGSVFDSLDLVGTPGQVLTSTGDGVEWYTLPPIFTPNLQQVLEVGNTADIDIILDANLQALDVTSETANVTTQLTIQGTVVDYNESAGTAGQVLESTVTGVQWTNLPVYSATSPLLFNPATGVFSIQVANSTQNGYLSSNDWVTFNGKQNAGSYITALTGEATATGPGSVPITLNNASVIAKVLTGLNVAGGSISASDSILTAFGKVQNQINGLVGGVQYQGTWNADTNTPTLTSSVGTQGHFYIVNVAGNTNLNGITDWKVGDWAIFNNNSWTKVDNTESVTSVNGQVGAVSLTTDDIPEGSTNLYYLNSRARAALSFAAGSGAYNSLTGIITIPTDNNQILNGAGYITLASLSATAPLSYNALTGAFSIPQATTLVDGYLSAIDWTTFNNKQNYLGGTGLVKSTAGTITYITDNSGNWNTAYDRSIISAAVTGTTTKTLTLNEQDGGTITASWTDLDTGLTSVGVSMPSAFSVANSPLTSNGTIAITGAGTSLQYIDGTGALQTFPGLTGFVPYTGATTNVNLGEFGISAGYFQADLTPTGALQVGRMQWNATDGTMDLRLLGNNVTLQIGQETVTRVVNKSGIDLLEANYQVVRIRKVAEGGAQGQRLAVVLAQGNNENNSTEVLGLVTETINSNQEGFITNFGEVKQINTTGSLQGETWVDGDVVYLSAVTPGQLTNIRPIAPNHAVIVGYVTYAHANNGKIYVSVDTGYELGELHNVYAPSPANKASIWWNSTTLRYENNTVAGILGYTPADAATTISTTAPLQGGGDLSANRTFSITQSGAASDGYLSSTDWNTFNNKQPAGSYVPTSRLLSINGTQYDLSADRSWSVGTVTSVAALTLGTTGTDLSSTVTTATTTPVITLNVPTASAANRGALSAADWSTFNTKVGSVTASSPLASSGGSTPNITIQQSSGSQDGYLSSTDWTTFNNKQASGNYITSLTGEATGTGPGATAVTLNNASVTAKILTGINITGGTVQATDTMLTAFGKLQNQINGLIGSTIYQGTWNASTNTPALASGVGVRGYYYIVSVAGNTNLDGITDWFIGDWAIFDGTAWQQVDNTDAVVSVNGQTGAVSLTTDNIPEGSTNQYFLNSRARAALSFTAGSGAYNSTTGVITIPTNNNQITNGANFITLASLSGTAPIQYNSSTGAISITQAGTASNGFLSSTDWNTFNNKQPAGNYVPYTGATTNVNLGVNSLTATGITVSKSAGVSTITFPAGTNDPAFISHTESTVNTGIMRFSVGDDDDTSDYFIFGNLSNPDRFRINANGIVSLGTWQATAIADAYIASAATWNAKQNAITLTTTGTSGAATFVGSTLNIPNYTTDLSGYLPLSGGTLTGPLNGTTSSFTGSVTVSSSNVTGGGIILADDGDIVDLNDGYASMRFSFGVRIYSANRGGAPVITLANTGAIIANGSVTASSLIKSGGTSSQYLMADGSTSTGPSLTGYVPYTGATSDVNIGGQSFTAGRGYFNYAESLPATTGTTQLGTLRLGSTIGGQTAVMDFGVAPGALAWIQSTDRTDLSAVSPLFLNPNGGNVSINSRTSLGYALGVSGTANISSTLGVGGDATFAGYINNGNNVRFPNTGLGISWGSATFSGSLVSKIFDNAQLFIWTDDQTNFASNESGAGAEWYWRKGVTPTGTGGTISMSLINNALIVTGTIAGSNLSGTNTGDQDLSGYITLAGTQTITGLKTINNNLLFGDSGTAKRGIQGVCGTNDYWFIGGGATATNAGFMEIATGDDAQTAGVSEPIYVSQYGPGDPLTGTLVRRATLLDENGNTYFPNTLGVNRVYAQNNIRPGDNGFGAIDFFNNGFGYSYSAKIFTFRSPDLTEAYGFTNDYGPSTSAELAMVAKGSTANIGFYTGTSTTAKMRLNPSGQLGIGTNPSYTLDVNGSISSNDIVRTNNFRLAGIMVLSGSGAEIGNSTGARLSESYGALWNFSNSSTWHHQIINGSSLVGFQSGGANFGSGNILASGDVTAYYSDERLKTKVSRITNAIEKIQSLEGFIYTENELARSLGYNNKREQAGLSAQQIQRVLPQAVSLAPFDMKGVAETGEIVSKSGENYLTVKYDRLVPLLIEAIKEQQKQIDDLKKQLA